MRTSLSNNQSFGAKFTCKNGKFNHLAENFEKKTSEFKEYRLHINETLNDGTDKFYLFDNDNYVLSTAVADFSNLKLKEDDAVDKLFEIFDILKIKHFTDNFIKRQIKTLYEDRDIMVKQMMERKGVTRNNSFDKIITE